MPPPKSKGVIFGADAAKKIADTVRRVAASPYFGVGPVQGPRNWNPGVLDAVVTTAIPPGNTNSYSTAGRAQILTTNNAGGRVNSAAYPQVVQVLNGYVNSGTINATVYIKVFWQAGNFHLLGADC